MASFLLGCQTQSESGFHFVGFFVIFSFFSVSGRVLPVTLCIESSVSILLGLRGLG